MAPSLLVFAWAALSASSLDSNSVYLAVCTSVAGSPPTMALLGTHTGDSDIVDVATAERVAEARENLRLKKWFRLSTRGQATTLGIMPTASASPADIGSDPEDGHVVQRLLLGPCERLGELYATDALSRLPRGSQRPEMWAPRADWMSKQLLSASAPSLAPMAWQRAELTAKNPQARQLGHGLTEVLLPFSMVIHHFPGSDTDVAHDGLMWAVFPAFGPPVVSAGGVTVLESAGETPPQLDWPRPALSYAGLQDRVWTVALVRDHDSTSALSLLVAADGTPQVTRHWLSLN